MHGTLEKKVPRPFGLAAWQPRDVSLEEDALVVVNAKRPADTKRDTSDAAAQPPDTGII